MRVDNTLRWTRNMGRKLLGYCGQRVRCEEVSRLYRLWGQQNSPRIDEAADLEPFKSSLAEWGGPEYLFDVDQRPDTNLIGRECDIVQFEAEEGGCLGDCKQ